MTNYFTFFEIPMTLSPDLTLLKKKYYINSREYHPDHHTMASQEEQDRILELSSTNNDGYKVLCDRDKRIKHILSLHNAISSTDASNLSPTFLMEMMELNEKIEEAITEDEKEARRLEIRGLDDVAFSKIASLHHVDLTDVGDEDIKKIKDYYFQHRYLLRIIENLDNLAAL